MMHILVSVITISIAFSVYQLGSFPFVLVTLGAGFILHELAHKYTAQRFGCFAVYRAWLPGLAIAIGLALITNGRFVFAAPGAVYIGGKHISTKENGMISAAGPLVNIVLGFLFLTFAGGPGWVGMIGTWGAFVNFFLALFNMIPFPPLDGSKVIQWNIIVWALLIAVPGFFLYGLF